MGLCSETVGLARKYIQESRAVLKDANKNITDKEKNLDKIHYGPFTSQHDGLGIDSWRAERDLWRRERDDALTVMRLGFQTLDQALAKCKE